LRGSVEIELCLVDSSKEVTGQLELHHQPGARQINTV
jgi:hypothetical protein